VGALCAANFTLAQEVGADITKLPFELTPYIGYQAGGEFSIADTDENAHVPGQVDYALAFNFRGDAETQYQVFYSRQPGHMDATSAFPNGVDVDIHYLHFGGAVRVDPGSFLEPYIVGTVGATLFSPNIPSTHDKQVFSVGFGAGLRVPVARQFSILMEARGFLSFMPSGGSLFCSSGDTGTGCRIHGSGSTFAQYALLVGAAFAF
jgi:hypothetical protein